MPLRATAGSTRALTGPRTTGPDLDLEGLPAVSRAIRAAGGGDRRATAPGRLALVGYTSPETTRTEAADQ